MGNTPKWCGLSFHNISVWLIPFTFTGWGVVKPWIPIHVFFFGTRFSRKNPRNICQSSCLSNHPHPKKQNYKKRVFSKTIHHGFTSHDLAPPPRLSRIGSPTLPPWSKSGASRWLRRLWRLSWWPIKHHYTLQGTTVLLLHLGGCKAPRTS